MQLDPESLIKSIVPFQVMQMGKAQEEQERARAMRLSEEASARNKAEATKRLLVG